MTMRMSDDPTLQQALRRFESYLKAQKLKKTPERWAVLKAIYAHNGHIEAAKLHAKIRQRHPGISLATVYNTLELLSRAGLVLAHRFDTGKTIYEKALGRYQHDHMLCQDCGRIVEFCDPALQEVFAHIEEAYDFEVHHHALLVYVRCRKDHCPHHPSAQSNRAS